jgi:AcrR family transcriptional regulator
MERPSTQIAKKPEKNQHGQKMGHKGTETRRRLLEATTRLLEEKGLRDLRVADIAREAQTSAATFYLYFKDVEGAVLCLVQESLQSTPRIMEILKRPWTRENVKANAYAFVSEYTEFWFQHQAVLRVRNLEADRGNHAFFEARMKSALPILEALSEKISAAQAKGHLDPAIHALSSAGVVMASLERLAASYTPNRPTTGITTETLVDAQARMLAHLLGGTES